MGPFISCEEKEVLRIRPLALPTNIRLDFIGANPLAYYKESQVMPTKKFSNVGHRMSNSEQLKIKKKIFSTICKCSTNLAANLHFKPKMWRRDIQKNDTQQNGTRQNSFNRTIFSTDVLCAAAVFTYS